MDEDTKANKVFKRIGLTTIGWYACVELHINKRRYWRFIDYDGALIETVRYYRSEPQAEQLLTISPSTFPLMAG